MATLRSMILLFWPFLLYVKSTGAVAQEDVTHGDGDILLGELEGFQERQFDSLVGAAPWLQGAGQLLRIFGDARFDNIMYEGMVLFHQSATIVHHNVLIRQGRQQSVVGTVLTTFMRLLGFDERQLGSRALDMVGTRPVIFDNMLMEILGIRCNHPHCG